MKRAVLRACVACAACLASSTALAQPVPEPAPTKTKMGVEVVAGIDYRRLYDFGLTTGDLAVAFRSERPTSSSFFQVELQGGGSQSGLPVFDGRVGAGLQRTFGRWRPGFGADLGVLSVARATTSSPAVSLELGVYAVASFDVVTLDDGDVFFVSGKLAADIVGAYPWPILWGPSAAVGYRF